MKQLLIILTLFLCFSLSTKRVIAPAVIEQPKGDCTLGASLKDAVMLQMKGIIKLEEERKQVLDVSRTYIESMIDILWDTPKKDQSAFMAYIYKCINAHFVIASSPLWVLPSLVELGFQYYIPAYLEEFYGKAQFYFETFSVKFTRKGQAIQKNLGKIEDWQVQARSWSVPEIAWMFPETCRNFIRRTSWFCFRLHPILFFVRIHDGEDIADDCPLHNGKPEIHVPFAGYLTVSKIKDKGEGYSAKILDLASNFSIEWLHLDKKGRTILSGLVKTGDHVGNIGSTGLSTGPHGHFKFAMFGIPFPPILIYDLETGEQTSHYLYVNKEKREVLGIKVHYGNVHTHMAVSPTMEE